MTPLDGEAFFTSQIADMPGFLNAAAKLLSRISSSRTRESALSRSASRLTVSFCSATRIRVFPAISSSIFIVFLFYSSDVLAYHGYFCCRYEVFQFLFCLTAVNHFFCQTDALFDGNISQGYMKGSTCVH